MLSVRCVAVRSGVTSSTGTHRSPGSVHGVVLPSPLGSAGGTVSRYLALGGPCPASGWLGKVAAYDRFARSTVRLHLETISGLLACTRPVGGSRGPRARTGPTRPRPYKEGPCMRFLEDQGPQTSTSRLCRITWIGRGLIKRSHGLIPATPGALVDLRPVVRPGLSPGSLARWLGASDRQPPRK